jgi:niacin transporter
MPSAAILPSMVFELTVYGTVSSLLMRFIPIKTTALKIYISLTGAMLSGRIVYGILNALIFKAGNYSIQIWLSAALLTAWPGILIQIFVIPTAVIALRKANLIEERHINKGGMNQTEQNEDIFP